jgi:hypothetical protein
MRILMERVNKNNKKVSKKLASLRDLLENWYMIVWRIDAAADRDSKVIISSGFSSCMSKCVCQN